MSLAGFVQRLNDAHGDTLHAELDEEAGTLRLEFPQAECRLMFIGCTGDGDSPPLCLGEGSIRAEVLAEHLGERLAVGPGLEVLLEEKMEELLAVGASVAPSLENLRNLENFSRHLREGDVGAVENALGHQGRVAASSPVEIVREFDYGSVQPVSLEELRDVVEFFGVSEDDPNSITMVLGGQQYDLVLPDGHQPFSITSDELSPVVQETLAVLNMDAARGVSLEQLLGMFLQEMGSWSVRFRDNFSEDSDSGDGTVGSLDGMDTFLKMDSVEGEDGDFRGSSPWFVSVEVPASRLSPALQDALAQDGQLVVSLTFPDGEPIFVRELSCAACIIEVMGARPILESVLRGSTQAFIQQWPTRSALSCEPLPQRPTAVQQLYQFGISGEELSASQLDKVHKCFASAHCDVDEILAQALDAGRGGNWIACLRAFLELVLGALPRYCPVCLRRHLRGGQEKKEEQEREEQAQAARLLRPCLDGAACQATFDGWELVVEEAKKEGV